MSKASIYEEKILSNILSTPGTSVLLYVNVKYKFNIREMWFYLGKMAAAVVQILRKMHRCRQSKTQLMHRMLFIGSSICNTAPACMNRGGQPLAHWRLSWLHKRRANVQRHRAQSPHWQQRTSEETNLPACESVFKWEAGEPVNSDINYSVIARIGRINT